jgi:hypothetical protein
VLADESGRIAQLFKHADFWVLFGSFFGFGLLLSLTPCVFPMIPILSSIIVGSGRNGHGVSHARGFAAIAGLRHRHGGHLRGGRGRGRADRHTADGGVAEPLGAGWLLPRSL